MKTIRQSITFDAAPHEVYDALTDSLKHSRITGSRASISRRVGGRFSIFNGEVNGVNLELEPGRKIVQTWRHCQECWPDDHYSKVTFLLKAVKDKTVVSFTHSAVPDKCYSTIKKGWRDWYWRQMKEKLNRGKPKQPVLHQVRFGRKGKKA